MEPHLALLPGATLAVGVSGGPDSMALLHAAVQFFGNSVVAVHVNYQLRPNAGADEARVWNLCEKLQCPMVVYRPGVDSPSEDALRSLRHEWFEELPFDFVLLGHHLEDQLETFLFRLLRGTGVGGLGAMRPKRGRLLRPFLSLRKSVLLDYCRAHSLDFGEDETNTEPHYFRNRIRGELLPTLYRLTDAFGGEDKFLERFHCLTQEIHSLSDSQKSWAESWIRKNAAETPFWVRVSLSQWRDLQWGEKAQLLRLLQGRLGYEAMDRIQVEEFIRQVDEGTPRGLALVLKGVISCGYLYLQPFHVKHSPELSWDGRRLSCEPLGLHLRFRSEWTGTEARFFRDGDTFGEKKLKRLLREIPRPERRLIPLIVRSGTSEVLWCFPGEHQELESQTVSFPYSFTNP